MRKVYGYLIMAVMLTVTAISMTSCDDDDADQAYDMNGIWEGTIQGDYYADRFLDSGYYTEIHFVQEGAFASGGYGVENDYPWDRSKPFVQVEFEWKVRDGRIYLVYEDGYRVVINDYEMYSVNGRMHFRGYFENYDTGERLASFDLMKTADEPGYDYAKKHKANFSEEATGDE